MSMLSAFKFMFSSKGFKKGLYRIYTVGKRFGLSAERQIECMKFYSEILKKYNIAATFFIPALILEKYNKQIRQAGLDNIEWGIHGYRHIDLSGLAPGQLKENIDSATKIFDDCGFSFAGFRAPYLKANIHLLDILAESGRFLYDSSGSVLFDNIYDSARQYFGWAKEFYNPVLFSSQCGISPKIRGMLELPVSLPDDDILWDKERIKVKQISFLWKEMLNVLQEKGGIFVLQLHPERVNEISEALQEFIEYARRLAPALSITTLGELARQPQERVNNIKALCITGDIDSLTMQGFITR